MNETFSPPSTSASARPQRPRDCSTSPTTSSPTRRSARCSSVSPTTASAGSASTRSRSASSRSSPGCSGRASCGPRGRSIASGSSSTSTSPGAATTSTSRRRSHAAAYNRRVPAELARVEYGHTTTYGTLAAQTGNPRAARAVGTVMNRNPVPIVLPCHRVVGANGKPHRLRRRARPQGAPPAARRRDPLGGCKTFGLATDLGCAPQSGRRQSRRPLGLRGVCCRRRGAVALCVPARVHPASR